MLFTEGKSQEYECMMQQKPDLSRSQIKHLKEKDCPRCSNFDQKTKKCSLKTCALFKD